MLNIINQFKRIYSDDGRNDVRFDVQESRLRKALEELKHATDEVIRASQMLSDVLIAGSDNKTRH